MKYTVSHNGVNCNLPVFTRGIKKKIDEVNDQISNTDIPLDTRIDSVYGFLRETVGEDILEKAFGGTDMDDIDLNDINILYLKISKEYDKPVDEFNKPDLLNEETRKALQEVDKMTKNLTAISKFTSK